MWKIRISITWTIVRGENVPKSYRTSAKAHANLFKKNFLAMYLEDLVFCIKRARWKVIKIHSHLTFEQERFKQKFILMNQKSRQHSKIMYKKIFINLWIIQISVLIVEITLTTASLSLYLTNINKSRLSIDIITFLTQKFLNLLQLNC